MPDVIFFKSTEVWGGGEKLTLSIMESVNQVKSKKLKVKSILFSNNQRMVEEAIRKSLTAKQINLGPEVARRRDIPGFLLRQPILVRRLTQLLSKYKPDYGAVVLQSLNERLIVTPIAKQLGYRVIWLEFQLWTPFLVKHPWIGRLIEYNTSVDQIIVNSHFAKKELVELGIDEQKVKILYSFVDTKHFQPLRTNKKRSRNNVFTMITVARLHQEKGIDVLIDALSKFKSKNPKVKIVLPIVGHGPERKNLERQAKQLGLQTSVQFLGEQTNVLPYLQSADLFVLPTRRDNCPNALLEAMACGLPSIATTVGGIPEIIDDGKNGLLVPPDNPEALAKAIQQLIAAPRLPKKLGTNARQTVEDKFSLKVLSETVRKLFFVHPSSAD